MTGFVMANAFSPPGRPLHFQRYLW